MDPVKKKQIRISYKPTHFSYTHHKNFLNPTLIPLDVEFSADECVLGKGPCFLLMDDHILPNSE